MSFEYIFFMSAPPFLGFIRLIYNFFPHVSHPKVLIPHSLRHYTLTLFLLLPPQPTPFHYPTISWPDPKEPCAYNLWRLPARGRRANAWPGILIAKVFMNATKEAWRAKCGAKGGKGVYPSTSPPALSRVRWWRGWPSVCQSFLNKLEGVVPWLCSIKNSLHNPWRVLHTMLRIHAMKHQGTKWRLWVHRGYSANHIMVWRS